MTSQPKLFFHVQHLLGIGHQMRAAALTRACLKAGFEVHYISGGFPEDLPDLGQAVFHQLPPTKTLNGDFNKLIDENGQLIDENWWENRKNILLNLYQEIKPDLILLEGFPFARRKFKEELIPLLDLAKQDNIPCATSIRDILVDPKTDKKRKFAFNIVDNYLSKILIHGEKAFCPLEKSFAGADILGSKLSYTGYVDGGQKQLSGRTEVSEVVISAGGGAVGAIIYQTAIDAFKLSKQRKGVWRILIGPNLDDRLKQKLLSQTQDGLVIEEARSDFRRLLNQAKLSVSQAGYNTVMDILSTGVESLLIPYAAGDESEQSLRANLLADTNRVSILEEKNLQGKNLADAIDKILANPTLRHHTPLEMQGAQKSAQLLMSLIKN